MIIARGTSPSGESLTLGLSHRNIEKLLEGKPILLRRSTHGDGVPEGWEIVIFCGETEDTMAATLKSIGAIGPDTTINRDPKLDKTL